MPEEKKTVETLGTCSFILWVRPCVTAKLPVLSFEALVLEPHFAQSCGRFLLLYYLLGWRTSLQRLKVAAHVLVKSWCENLTSVVR